MYQAVALCVVLRRFPSSKPLCPSVCPFRWHQPPRFKENCAAPAPAQAAKHSAFARAPAQRHGSSLAVTSLLPRRICRRDFYKNLQLRQSLTVIAPAIDKGALFRYFFLGVCSCHAADQGATSINNATSRRSYVFLVAPEPATTSTGRWGEQLRLVS